MSEEGPHKPILTVWRENPALLSLAATEDPAEFKEAVAFVLGMLITGPPEFSVKEQLAAAQLVSLIRYGDLQPEPSPPNPPLHTMDWTWRIACVPCRCGSLDLHMHTWHMHGGANVWCGLCSAGTPAGSDEDARDLNALVSNSDARGLAIEKWNAWARAGDKPRQIEPR